MHLMRENINVKVNRQLEYYIETLKIKFDNMLKKQIIDIIQMLKTEFVNVVVNVFNNVFINVFVNVFIDAFINVFVNKSFTSFFYPSLLLILIISSKPSKVEKIKYFDSNYKQKKKNYIISKIRIYNSVINVNKYIYYIEIYCFINKLKDFVKQHNKINVFVNLRNIAFV